MRFDLRGDLVETASLLVRRRIRRTAHGFGEIYDQRGSRLANLTFPLGSLVGSQSGQGRAHLRTRQRRVLRRTPIARLQTRCGSRARVVGRGVARVEVRLVGADARSSRSSPAARGAGGRRLSRGALVQAAPTTGVRRPASPHRGNSVGFERFEKPRARDMVLRRASVLPFPAMVLPVGGCSKRSWAHGKGTTDSYGGFRCHGTRLRADLHALRR